METRTFVVEGYLCFSECFLSLSSRSVHPAASALLFRGVTDHTLVSVVGEPEVCPHVWAEAPPGPVDVVPETSSSVTEPEL